MLLHQIDFSIQSIAYRRLDPAAQDTRAKAVCAPRLPPSDDKVARHRERTRKGLLET